MVGGQEMNKRKTQSMAYLALFLAIQVILVITPLGYLPIGPLSLTTMHIPVIVGGILFGEKVGMTLGFVFGLTSMLNATFRPGITSFVFTPFVSVGGIHGNWASLLVAFIPRILIGYTAAVTFKHFINSHLNKNLSVIISSSLGSIINTFLVLGGIYVFFGEAYAKALGIGYDLLVGVLMSVVVSNGILEAIFGSFVSILIYKAIAPSLNK